MRYEYNLHVEESGDTYAGRHKQPSSRSTFDRKLWGSQNFPQKYPHKFRAHKFEDELRTALCRIEIPQIGRLIENSIISNWEPTNCRMNWELDYLESRGQRFENELRGSSQYFWISSKSGQNFENFPLTRITCFSRWSTRKLRQEDWTVFETELYLRSVRR
jgi:hypothetical protein